MRERELAEQQRCAAIKSEAPAASFICSISVYACRIIRKPEGDCCIITILLVRKWVGGMYVYICKGKML